MLISTTRMADGATLATIGLGTSLTFAPRQTAAMLGLGPHHRRARAIGIADLVLGSRMLLGSSRARWMAARAAFNVVIAGCYLDEFRRSGSRRAQAGATGMAALTVVDGAVAYALRQRESSD
jgi:hypothetical protein